MKKHREFPSLFTLTVLLFLLNVCFALFAFVTQRYPTPLVVLHFLSITLLLGYCLKSHGLYSFLFAHKGEIAIVAALVTGSFFLRLYRLAEITPGMWGDEVTVAQVSESLTHAPFTPFSPINFGHPTLTMYPIGYAIALWGRNIVAIRIVSVAFASLSVGLFYCLLRLFFPRFFSILFALVFSLSYSFLIVSRFAYEMAPAIFFQILFFIAGIVFLRTKKPAPLLLAGLAIGFGLNTYLGFRLHALLYIILGVVAVIRTHWGVTKRLSLMILFFSAVLLPLTFLLPYALSHPKEINARVASVSIFSQNLSKEEIIKELGGNIKRDANMFFEGDLNPRQNPSVTPLFDPITTLFLFSGAIVFLIKKRRILFFFLLLLLPSLANDIFTVEIFPEFHVYGTGHPNVLRLSLMIPVVVFFAAFFAKELTLRLSTKFSQGIISMILILLVLLSLGINYHWYFNQPLTIYNYFVNGVPALNITTLTHNEIIPNLYVSKSYFEDRRLNFFKHPRTKLSLMNLASPNEVPEQAIIVLNPDDNLPLAQNIIQSADKEHLKVQKVFDPWGNIETLIFWRQ